jgi:hypothetical protein
MAMFASKDKAVKGSGENLKGHKLVETGWESGTRPDVCSVGYLQSL